MKRTRMLRRPRRGWFGAIAALATTGGLLAAGTSSAQALTTPAPPLEGTYMVTQGWHGSGIFKDLAMKNPYIPKGHSIDLGLREGATGVVYAVGDGKISWTCDNGRDAFTVIDHGSLGYVSYVHLNTGVPRTGTNVKAGQKLGTIYRGSFANNGGRNGQKCGRSDATHLHMGFSRKESLNLGGTAFDPAYGQSLTFKQNSTPTPTPKAVPGHSRIASPTAENVFYVDENDHVANAYHDNGVWRTASIGGSVRHDSPIAAATKDRAFYITANSRLANAYYGTDGKWHVDYVGNITVKPGSGLSSPDDNTVYFIDAVGNLAHAYYDNNRWNAGAITHGVRPKSPLASPVAGQVFYFDTSNRLASASHNGKWSARHIGGQARAGSGLTSPDREHAYFVDTNGRIANAWKPAGQDWKVASISGSVRSGSPLDAPNNSTVYYFDSSNRLAHAWHSGTWRTNALAATTALAGSGLDSPQGAALRFYYASSAGYLANAWHTGYWNTDNIGGDPR